MAWRRPMISTKALLASRLTYESAKTTLFYYVLVTQLLKAKRHLRARGIPELFRELRIWISEKVILLALRFPAASRNVQAEMGKAKLDIERKIIPRGAEVTRHLTLPTEGKSLEWILQEMDKMDVELGSQANWRLGKLSGAVYHGGEDLERVIVAAFQRYCVSNPLHPDVFPAIRKMEAEVVSMCLRIHRGPDGAGTMTSGGTESIVMACKTYRDWARETKGITEPEMVIPSSAHAAFKKSAAYFNIKVHIVPVHPLTRKVNVEWVKRAINGNTIMLVGSSVNFPDGNEDPITALASLAAAHDIGMHVDSCLGSFIMPFLKAAGLADGQGKEGMYKMEDFDFGVKGVTSISCDTHKYGFSPKGSSVIMYRSAELRRYQYHVDPLWSGGVYASPSLSGSRPGALIAGTWATMQYIGYDGYLESCRSIVTCTRTIARAITDTIPPLYIMGSPPASCIAFASNDPEVNVLEVGDAMSRRGWYLNAVGGSRSGEVKGVHIVCTRMTIPLVDTFIADLKDAVEEARRCPNGKGHMVTVYGLGNSSAVGPRMVGQLATAYLDATYKA